MAASILFDTGVELRNVPNELRDVVLHAQMLEALGWSVDASNESMRILATRNLITELEWNGRSIRNTLLILGALIARFGRGRVPLPGGCNLGDRKYDLHELVLRSLGASVSERDGYLIGEAPRGGLVGGEIRLPIRSTGATENAVICGSLAKGRTIVWNPHVRPEILDLIAMLRAAGVKIEVFGQERIEIHGVERLTSVVHTVIPDNMEALTWLVAGAMTNGEIEIVGFPLRHLEVPLIFLRESGVNFYKKESALLVRPGEFYPLDISTGPYPGINSDMQPIMAVFGALSHGETRIVDLRFPGRYAYAEELARLGVISRVEDNLLRIEGGNRLVGARVCATDLRAGIALVLAGLVADGVTVIADAWQVERGYDKFLDKLRQLGGDIRIG